MKSIIILFTLSVLILSCTRQESAIQNPNTFVIADEDRNFVNQLGEYKHFFNKAEGYQGFRLHGSGIYAGTSKSTQPTGYTETTLGTVDGYDKFFVNEYSVSELNNMSKEERVRIIENQLGESVQFKYKENNTEVYNISMYTPEEIVIDTSLSQITKIPTTRIGNLKLGNNIYVSNDNRNQNGLLISLSYRGYSINTSLSELQDTSDDIYVKKYLHVIDDTGIIDFPDGFFEGIPNGGIFYLQINRLNFNLFDLDNGTHKIAAGSSFGIDLALER